MFLTIYVFILLVLACVVGNGIWYFIRKYFEKKEENKCTCCLPGGSVNV